MSFLSILILALGLGMDATAVSAARALCIPRISLRHVLLVALFFGGAQALMPMIGWHIGAHVGPLVQTWDHWIAFSLLLAVGVTMLRASDSPPEEAPPCGDPDGSDGGRDAFAPRVMALLAVATSIDALAAGISLPMVDAPFLLSLATIGVTTALLSIAGLVAGRRLGPLLGRHLSVFGGVVLIGIGTKILVQHLSA